ncbi:MAG: ankyrin repeat domain-containing protein [Acidobacteria bacterium]|nr:ankyrin repeat domain-containing protein [Acidobacteriota bacterium]
MRVTTRALTSTQRWTGRQPERRPATRVVADTPPRRACRTALAPASGLALVLALTLGTASAAAGAGLDAPLIDAVRQGDAAAVRAALDAAADVDARQPDGATALHWAARLDRLDVARLLLAAGADPSAANAFDVTPLSLAAVNGSAEMIATLLAAGADPNATMAGSETVLLTAARTGRTDAVHALIGHGADVNAAQAAGQTALMWAAAEGHVETVEALINAGADVGARTVVPENPLRTGLEGPAPHGFTALLFAVRAGHIDTARVLIAAGADPNDTLPDGMNTVTLAATNAHWELGISLIDQGADPNGAGQGWAALHAMTWVRMPNFGFNPPGPVTTGTIDSLTFARELVARGADVDLRMTAEPRNGYRNALNRVGATPLLMAARLADAPLMRVLLDLGADPTIPNEDGTTLLMVASGVGIHSPGEDPGTEAEARACVELALALGGDPNAVDDIGETALHGAAYRGANSIVELLVAHGAATFDVENTSGWTPLRIAQGVFRTATYKEAPHTAALLAELMDARELQP